MFYISALRSIAKRVQHTCWWQCRKLLESWLQSNHDNRLVVAFSGIIPYNVSLPVIFYEWFYLSTNLCYTGPASSSTAESFAANSHPVSQANMDPMVDFLGGHQNINENNKIKVSLCDYCLGKWKTNKNPVVLKTTRCVHYTVLHFLSIFSS